MTELFHAYETHFLTAIRILQQQLAQNHSIQEMNQALAEATQELSKMELEYSMCKHKDMKSKIALYKADLKNYKRKVAENKEARDDNDRLSDENLQKQENGNLQLLEEGRRQMYENVEISNQAMLGIRKNNEKLQKNISRVSDIDSGLGSAQQLLSSIKFKMAKNRYILYGTGSVFMLLIILVVYTHLK